MRLWISFFLAAMTMGFNSYGATARVVKSKGKRAILEFPGKAPAVGSTVQLGGPNSSSGDETSYAESSRANSIDVGTGITKAFGGGALSTSLSGKYGWNTGHMEFGPILIFSFVSSTGSDSTSLGGGGFFDYNITSNQESEWIVPGLGLDATFAYSRSSTGVTTVATTGYSLGGGPFVKLFFLRRSQTGLRLGLKGNFNKSGKLESTKSFGLEGGLSTYF